jgi:hypothetical protein
MCQLALMTASSLTSNWAPACTCRDGAVIDHRTGESSGFCAHSHPGKTRKHRAAKEIIRFMMTQYSIDGDTFRRLLTLHFRLLERRADAVPPISGNFPVMQAYSFLKGEDLRALSDADARETRQ